MKKQVLASWVAVLLILDGVWWVKLRRPVAASSTLATTAPALRKQPDGVSPGFATRSAAELGAAPASGVDRVTRALMTSAPHRRAHRFQSLGFSMAADLVQALRILADLTDPEDRLAYIRGLFEALAQGDAAKALEASKQIADPTEKQTALAALVRQWTGLNRDASMIRAQNVAHSSVEAGMGLELVRDPADQPELAALWARTLLPGESGTFLLTLAMIKEYGRDPALAESYGEGLSGQARDGFNETLLDLRIRANPAAAWQQSSTISDPADRHLAQNHVVENWSSQDPLTAAQKLLEIPEDSREPATVEVVAMNYVMHTDANTALAWANILSASERPTALSTIGGMATAGLGVLLGEGSGRYPCVNAVEIEDEALLTGPLHKQDQILGLGRGDGTFVDVQHLSLLQVADLMNGATGGAVQLQVAPATRDGNHGPPVVVQIVRPVKKNSAPRASQKASV